MSADMTKCWRAFKVQQIISLFLVFRASVKRKMINDKKYVKVNTYFNKNSHAVIIQIGLIKAHINCNTSTQIVWKWTYSNILGLS